MTLWKLCLEQLNLKLNMLLTYADLLVGPPFISLFAIAAIRSVDVDAHSVHAHARAVALVHLCK